MQIKLGAVTCHCTAYHAFSLVLHGSSCYVYTAVLKIKSLDSVLGAGLLNSGSSAH